MAVSPAEREALHAAAFALREYRTANGCPREGFDAAARLLTMLAEGHTVQPGVLEAHAR